jgi:NAD(P)H-dependent flavin oxidoreductase YrpB (nitropropane dioxygenase family)
MTAEEMMGQLKKGELAYQGNIEDGSILLGQSIGIINKIESVKDIINTIVSDAEKSLKLAYRQIK